MNNSPTAQSACNGDHCKNCFKEHDSCLGFREPNEVCGKSGGFGARAKCNGQHCKNCFKHKPTFCAPDKVTSNNYNAIDSRSGPGVGNLNTAPTNTDNDNHDRIRANAGVMFGGFGSIAPATLNTAADRHTSDGGLFGSVAPATGGRFSQLFGHNPDTATGGGVSSLFGRVSTAPTVSQDSVVQYLKTFFSNPEALLAGMAKANLILSGSRAVEVFVPGSCTAQSDFDFYVDASARCVGEAIKVLRNAGVHFDQPYKLAVDIAAAPSGSLIEFHYTSKGQFERLLVLPSLPRDAARVLRELLASLGDSLTSKFCTVYNGVHVHLIYGRPPGNYNYSSSTQLEIITGRTLQGPIKYKIQLIFAKGKSPLTHVFDFYASCVQAVITGFGAAHLYFAFSHGHNACYWPSNTQNKKSAEAAMAKYALRGYHFTLATNRSMRVKVLSSDDMFKGGSKLVLFNTLPLTISAELFAARQAFFQNLTWMEHAGETTLLSKPPLQLREILAKERRKRIALRANHVRDDDSFELATMHSISFVQLGRMGHSPARFPDEIVGL